MTIKECADRLLGETGLKTRLENHGRVYITGSYLMDMMVWNDLDIYLCPNDGFDLYAMIADVNAALRPFRFDGMEQPRENRRFYGVETNVIGERWNVDIWVKNEMDILKSLAYCGEIRRRAQESPSLGQAILNIKSALIGMGAYGFDKHPFRHYHSSDIYAAVLEEGISSAEEFLRKHPL